MYSVYTLLLAALSGLFLFIAGSSSTPLLIPGVNLSANNETLCLFEPLEYIPPAPYTVGFEKCLRAFRHEDHARPICLSKMDIFVDEKLDPTQDEINEAGCIASTAQVAYEWKFQRIHERMPKCVEAYQLCKPTVNDTDTFLACVDQARPTCDQETQRIPKRQVTSDHNVRHPKRNFVDDCIAACLKFGISENRCNCPGFPSYNSYKTNPMILVEKRDSLDSKVDNVRRNVNKIGASSTFKETAIDTLYICTLPTREQRLQVWYNHCRNIANRMGIESTPELIGECRDANYEAHLCPNPPTTLTPIPTPTPIRRRGWETPMNRPSRTDEFVKPDYSDRAWIDDHNDVNDHVRQEHTRNRKDGTAYDILGEDNVRMPPRDLSRRHRRALIQGDPATAPNEADLLRILNDDPPAFMDVTVADDKNSSSSSSTLLPAGTSVPEGYRVEIPNYPHFVFGQPFLIYDDRSKFASIPSSPPSKRSTSNSHHETEPVVDVEMAEPSETEDFGGANRNVTSKRGYYDETTEPFGADWYNRQYDLYPCIKLCAINCCA